jgi:hypothetical protein
MLSSVLTVFSLKLHEFMWAGTVRDGISVPSQEHLSTGAVLFNDCSCTGVINVARSMIVPYFLCMLLGDILQILGAVWCVVTFPLCLPCRWQMANTVHICSLDEKLLKLIVKRNKSFLFLAV